MPDDDATETETPAESDPLAPFDAALLDRVAADHDRSAKALRALVARHQTFVREYEEVGGVDGLVYEWRQTFPEDPLVGRTRTVYYLAAGDRIWGDFAERLDVTPDEAAALRAVHDGQFRADRDVEPGRAPMLLVKE